MCPNYWLRQWVIRIQGYHTRPHVRLTFGREVNSPHDHTWDVRMVYFTVRPISDYCTPVDLIVSNHTDSEVSIWHWKNRDKFGWELILSIYYTLSKYQTRIRDWGETALLCSDPFGLLWIKKARAEDRPSTPLEFFADDIFPRLHFLFSWRKR
jgi:hypothetical protein